MDHAEIDENQVADRYVMEKLPEEERHRFEEHLVDCPRCLERLETVESLRAALKELKPEEVAAPARLRGWRKPALAIWLAAACLLLAVSSVFFYGELSRTRRDLTSVKHTSEQAQRRQAELGQALREEQAARARLSDAAGALRAAPLFILNLTRGASPAEPENRVVLDRAPGWVTLVVDRPDGPGLQDYRVRLSTADGRPIGDAVAAYVSTGGMLAVSLPSALLTPGDYMLMVEGLGMPEAETLATYRFRVLARK